MMALAADRVYARDGVCRTLITRAWADSTARSPGPHAPPACRHADGARAHRRTDGHQRALRPRAQPVDEAFGHDAREFEAGVGRRAENCAPPRLHGDARSQVGAEAGRRAPQAAAAHRAEELARMSENFWPDPAYHEAAAIRPERCGSGRAPVLSLAEKRRHAVGDAGRVC